MTLSLHHSESNSKDHGIRINTLAIDANPVVLSTYETYFSNSDTIDFATGSTPDEAARMLWSGSYDVCVCSTEVCRHLGEDFGLLERFGRRTFFIMTSDRGSMWLGFLSCHYGAFSALDLDSALVAGTLRRHIMAAYTFRRVNPMYRRFDRSPMNVATETLIHHAPETVAQWASQARITRTYLDSICRECLKSSPPELLDTLHELRSALGPCPNLLSGGSSPAIASAIG